MSDCITVLIVALVIALFLGDRDDCSSGRNRRSCNDRCDNSCGCDRD